MTLTCIFAWMCTTAITTILLSLSQYLSISLSLSLLPNIFSIISFIKHTSIIFTLLSDPSVSHILLTFYYSTLLLTLYIIPFIMTALLLLYYYYYYYYYLLLLLLLLQLLSHLLLHHDCYCYWYATNLAI